MATVALDKVDFISKIILLKGAAAGLTTDVNEFQGYRSDSRVIDKYVELFDELSLIVTIYQELLYKDIDSILKMGMSIGDMDSRISKRWSNQ